MWLCVDVLMYNYVESERNICVIVLLPCPPPPPSWSCKVLRAFKDRHWKITIIITIINSSYIDQDGIKILENPKHIYFYPSSISKETVTCSDTQFHQSPVTHWPNSKKSNCNDSSQDTCLGRVQCKQFCFLSYLLFCGCAGQPLMPVPDLFSLLTL